MKKQMNKWHLVLILISITILTLSALPTFYGKVPVISIQTLSTSTKLPSMADIRASLKSSQIDIAAIHTMENQILIQASDKNADLATLQSHLAKHLNAPSQLNHQYIINIDEKQASPIWLQSMGFNAIELGLDLNGGVLFVLDVDVASALNERMQGIVDELKQSLQSSRIFGVDIDRIVHNSIKVSFRNQEARQKFKALVQAEYPELIASSQSKNKLSVVWEESEVIQFERTLMQQSLSIMRNRIESLGITEAAVARQGKTHIRIELPGIKNPKQAAKIIGSTATLDVYALASRDNAKSNHLKTFKNENGRSILVKKKTIFSGHNIQSASAGIDENGMPLVNLVLDTQGGDQMTRFSKANIGQAIVTVLSEYKQNKTAQQTNDSKVINVATVVTQLGNRFSITNLSSSQEAQELAMLIRAGSLNAPVSIVTQRTIDPSLGEENVNSGFAALLLGIAITLMFMALWYRRLGLIANASLVINLLCLLGLMAWLPGVVLTLPGIAGLVLTVGMAVDTNVLVFEKIKQQAKKQQSPALAIESGYQQALRTILDANITTMICAVILYAIGNGPVKGFAVILCLGLITSMFSGVFVAKFLSRLFPAHSLIRRKENV